MTKTFKDVFPTLKLDDEMWWERQQEIDQYRQQCLESFFKYFTKYFHSLWI